MRISTYIRRTDFITALTAILFPICLPRPVGRADLCSHHGLDLLLWLSQPVLGATIIAALALFAALAGVLRVQGNLKLRRS